MNRIPSREEYLAAKEIVREREMVRDEILKEAYQEGIAIPVNSEEAKGVLQKKYSSIHDWWNSLPSDVEVTCDDMAYDMGLTYAGDTGLVKVYNKMIRKMPGCREKRINCGSQATKETFIGKKRAVFITPKSLVTTGENPSTLKVVR